MKQYHLIGIDLNLGGVIYPENSVISLNSEPDSFLSKYLVEIPPNSLLTTDDDFLRDDSQLKFEVLLVPNAINTVEPIQPNNVEPVSTNQKQKFKGKFKP
jgi:hypothetical protein